jgi:hypothetical protein
MKRSKCKSKTTKRRLRVPKYKKFIIQGMSPNDTLEKVWKQFKGTRHDSSSWKKRIKLHISNYVKLRKEKNFYP